MKHFIDGAVERLVFRVEFVIHTFAQHQQQSAL
jgi:hypothetical protein